MLLSLQIILLSFAIQFIPDLPYRITDVSVVHADLNIKQALPPPLKAVLFIQYGKYYKINFVLSTNSDFLHIFKIELKI